MPHVLVVGSVNADVIVDVDRLPLRGETIAASKTDTGTFCPGGKGANQAAAAARLSEGTPSLMARFVGQFGHDAHGAALEKALVAAGVDVTLSGHPACASGQAFVFVYPDGDNSIVIVGGANAAWEAQLPPSVEAAIREAAIVLLQCEIPAYVNELVAKCAAAAKVPVLWDAGGEDRVLPTELLHAITFLAPNETELARMAQCTVNNEADAIAAARKLQQQGAQNVLVTLGGLGSILVPVDATAPIVRQQCFKVAQVVDTTGAGDCYRSAFAVAIAQGKTFQESMAFAAAASALCVQTRGAMPSMPTAAMTVEFLQQQKHK
ncbi:TPA: hypothetical protein N0F65_012031 [Lagenidium giganteum]|uniref:Ribokinase n=1 Tax=Lagenidium giganteum TaxID=4803 RepID=A0AAV2YU74_9STRA|nr:TPA: hypothetical protein N0F65_012031 [Lagenidium giganteum]